MTLIAFIMLILAVEAVTEIIVASEAFTPFREKSFAIHPKLGTLFSCGYCLSVWVATFFLSFMTIPGLTCYPIVSGLIVVFAVHRLSGIWHEFISRWLNRAPIVLAIHKTETIVMENNSGRD